MSLAPLSIRVNAFHAFSYGALSRPELLNPLQGAGFTQLTVELKGQYISSEIEPHYLPSADSSIVIAHVILGFAHNLIIIDHLATFGNPNHSGRWVVTSYN